MTKSCSLDDLLSERKKGIHSLTKVHELSVSLPDPGVVFFKLKCFQIIRRVDTYRFLQSLECKSLAVEYLC